MIHRTIATFSRFTAVIFKWLVTFLLLMELCISSRGMSALVAGTAAGSGKQTQSTAAGGNGVQAATQQRKPRKISLKALDLTRAPTEEELKMAGAG